MKWFFIAAPIIAAACFFILFWMCAKSICFSFGFYALLLILFVIQGRKRKVLNQTRSHPHTVYVVPEGQSRTALQNKDFLERRPVYGNQESQEYLVPYSALPVNFDFSARDIKVFGDYVIIKDLTMLEHPSNVNAPSPMTAYEKQSPYNPDFIQRF